MRSFSLVPNMRRRPDERGRFIPSSRRDVAESGGEVRAPASRRSVACCPAGEFPALIRAQTYRNYRSRLVFLGGGFAYSPPALQVRRLATSTETPRCSNNSYGKRGDTNSFLVALSTRRSRNIFRTATDESAVQSARRLYSVEQIFHRALQLLERHIAAAFDQRLHPVMSLRDGFRNARYRDTYDNHVRFSLCTASLVLIYQFVVRNLLHSSSSRSYWCAPSTQFLSPAGHRCSLVLFDEVHCDIDDPAPCGEAHYDGERKGENARL